MARHKHGGGEQHVEESHEEAPDESLSFNGGDEPEVSEDGAPHGDLPSGKQFINIKGTHFVVSAPYVSGHVLKENEARALNGLWAENLRNNAAARMKAFQEEGKDYTQEMVDELDSAYSFGTRGGRHGARPVDAVAVEERKLASDAVRAAIKKQGIPLKQIAADDLTAYIDRAVEMGNYRAAAEKIVEARKTTTPVDADILNIPAQNLAEAAD